MATIIIIKKIERKKKFVRKNGLQYTIMDNNYTLINNKNIKNWDIHGSLLLHRHYIHIYHTNIYNIYLYIMLTQIFGL